MASDVQCQGGFSDISLGDSDMVFTEFSRGVVCYPDAIPEIWPTAYMSVSKNRGTPKSSILIGFSITNHPFWGIPIFGNTHINLNLYYTKMV